MGQSFIVQVPNCPGELGHLARALGTRGINVQHLVGCGSGESCCALLVTDDAESTDEVLRGIGLDYVLGGCVVAEIADTDGAIDGVKARLADGGVKLHRSCVVSRGNGRMEVGLAVDDESRAREALGMAHAAAGA